MIDVLDGSGQQAELVALGITQYHPTDVWALAHVSAPRAEGEQALELLGSGYAVGSEVEMQPDSTIGIMTTVTELDLAVQQADGLQETISRAYGGNAVIQWFDEVDPPETD